LKKEHPDWSQEKIKDEADASRGHVSNTLAEWRNKKESEMSQSEGQVNNGGQASLPDSEDEGRGTFEDTNISQKDLINLDDGLPAGYWFRVTTALLKQSERDDGGALDEKIAKIITQQVTFNDDSSAVEK